MLLEASLALAQMFMLSSERHHLPRYLLEAVCRVESDLDPLSLEINDGGPGNHSFGICQISHRTASEVLKFKVQPACLRRKNLVRSHRSAAICSLYDPATNIELAATYLSMQYSRYSKDADKATAAYNAGSAIYRHKELINREYVNKVFTRWKLVKKMYISRTSN